MSEKNHVEITNRDGEYFTVIVQRLDGFVYFKAAPKLKQAATAVIKVLDENIAHLNKLRAEVKRIEAGKRRK